MRNLLAVSVFVAALGCGKIDPPKNPSPAPVTATVTQGGKPVTDVTLTLQVVGDVGAMANLQVKNGSAKGAVIPGTYTYFIAESTSPAAFNRIPDKYKIGSMDRKIEVKADANLDIKLD